MIIKLPALVIMAAGIGSRYGGLKQMDPMDEEGHLLLDYSIYDAIRAGFQKIILVIRKEMEKDFREHMQRHFTGQAEFIYVHQKLEDLPEGYSLPEGRTKPWGTGHALLAARTVIEEPFAVINSDDYYGPEAFRLIYDDLMMQTRAQNEIPYHFAMVAYRIENTVTENGSVSRGVCAVDEEGYLVSITERVRIEKCRDGIAFTEDEGKSWTKLAEGTPVSMNLWGFSEAFMTELFDRFSGFLKENLKKNPLKSEYFIPAVVQQLLEEGKARVKVLSTREKWFGVTYKEDKAQVMQALAGKKKAGDYMFR